MATKFDHIPLSRDFRPVLLATLKDHAGWPAYMAGQGLGRQSQAMDRDAILTACEALGVDVETQFHAFHGYAPNSRATVAAIVGAAAAATANAERDAEIEAWLAKDEPSADDTDADTAGHRGTTDTAGTVPTVSAFEGRDVDELIAETLAPASVHMTQHLAGMLPGLIRDIVAAAVAGPRTVREVETRTITVDADGVPVAPAVPAWSPPAVSVVATLPLWKAFDVARGSVGTAYKYAIDHVKVGVCDYAYAPAVDDDFFWQAEVLCDLAVQDNAGLNAWLFGPASTGKTTALTQYAARLRRPFFRIAMERTTEVLELIGQEVPSKSGGMTWSDGKLTRAFRVPHAVILIDEPTYLRSGTLAVLQTALDTRSIHLSTGEVVHAAPGIFICVCDNTAGNGDDTGRYIDTAPLNAAFLDRFALKTEVSWLTPTQETNMLSARTGLHEVAARIMVDYATSTRTNAEAGQLTMGVTMRRLLAWARAVMAGLNSARAWHSAIVTGAAPEDREKLLLLASTDLKGKHARIDQIARNEIDPYAPVVEASAAALAFPDDDAGDNNETTF